MEQHAEKLMNEQSKFKEQRDILLKDYYLLKKGKGG